MHSLLVVFTPKSKRGKGDKSSDPPKKKKRKRRREEEEEEEEGGGRRRKIEVLVLESKSK